MLRSSTPLRALSFIAFLALPASAADTDQEQLTHNQSHTIDSMNAAWQTFTPSIAGWLDYVTLRLDAQCAAPPCETAPGLVLYIVGVSETGIPLPTVVLGGATVLADPFDPAGGLADFIAPVRLSAGRKVAIGLTSAGGGASEFSWAWRFAEGGDPYPDGELFHDTQPGDGLDDPTTPGLPGSDATFTTYMTPGFCGDGVEDAPEACDDGNTASGDGCSAACVEEFCGDGIVNGGNETCEDTNTIDGDGCSAACLQEFCGDSIVNNIFETCDGVFDIDNDGCTSECTLEAPALGCQTAIVKGGQKYVTARLAALAKCRLTFAAGKATSIANPRDCATDPATAKALDKAGDALRKAIAGGRRPKCTDALVAPLGACAGTVDGLVTPDGSTGCLITESEASVQAVIESQLGR